MRLRIHGHTLWLGYVLLRGRALATVPGVNSGVAGSGVLQRLYQSYRTANCLDAIQIDQAYRLEAAAMAKAPKFGRSNLLDVYAAHHQLLQKTAAAEEAVRYREATTWHDVDTAQRFFGEGRKAFATLALADRMLLDQGSQAILLTWLGDAANEAIACLLMSHGMQAFRGRLGVEIQRAGRSLEEIENLLADIGSEPAPPVNELLAKASNLVRQKMGRIAFITPAAAKLCQLQLGSRRGTGLASLDVCIAYISSQR